METNDHIPSLTHLREFTRARVNGRATHVEQDRKQVSAPSGDRIFAFVYEKFLSRVKDYVAAGNRGGALDRAVAETSDRMRASYQAAATGMSRLLASMQPSAVARRQRNVVVVDDDGYELVSLRVHLVFETHGGRVAAFMYFSDKALTPVEVAIMETAVACAVGQIDPGALPAILMARKGELHLVDKVNACSPERVAFLRAESMAYRAAWAVAE